jgi:hypothetical protein
VGECRTQGARGEGGETLKGQPQREAKSSGGNSELKLFRKKTVAIPQQKCTEIHNSSHPTSVRQAICGARERG